MNAIEPVTDQKTIEEIADKKAANLNHQRKIHREIIEDMSAIFGDEFKIVEFIKKAATNQIRNITVNYNG